jgi:cytochrome P450
MCDSARMEVAVAAVPQLPFGQSNPLQVSPVMRELQAKGAVHRVRTELGDRAWLVTRHDHVQRLLDDERLGLTHPEPDTAARMSESALYGGPMPNFATEHADHARRRALLQPHFAPRHVRALRPRVDAMTSGLLDDMTENGPPADLHRAVASALPVLVICELLGVPYKDREQFGAWTTDAANTRDRARSERGLGRLSAYSRALVARKRQEPGDDVISRLCADEGLSDDEVAGLATGLLWAGHETTVNQIGLGALLLLANPEQWRALVDNPALAPDAVEETLRASRRGGGVLPRYARTELEVDGVTIKAGDLVLLGIAAANHDPSVFADPERVDITRPVPGHLTFGHGRRYCVGAPLARLELCAVFSQLASRFPTMRLASGVGELAQRTEMLFGGLTELPVRW